MIANIISIYVIIGLLIIVAVLVCTLLDDGYVHDFIVKNYDMYGALFIAMLTVLFVAAALVWPAVIIILACRLAKNR